jgi:CheY-like chemotaxis protein
MPRRILIVDDNQPTREIIRELVTKHGHLTGEARDGNDAIECVKQGDIDGMILDLVMPDRDGLEVLVWLKSERPDMPVVVMTNAGEGRDISYPEIAERFGALKAFFKPVTKENVDASVRLLEDAWNGAAP